MDQSFSIDNFKKILIYENRKGRNLEKEFFPEIFEVTKSITEINKKIQKRLSFKIKDDKVVKELNEEKIILKKCKSELVEKKLGDISELFFNPKFRIEIKKVETGYKPIYITTQTAENYFAIKQLQLNVKKSFNVKQANRFAIINQVRTLLIDNFTKVILRTDIKSFYESIPHDRLLAKINDNPLLSFLSKKLIVKILNGYLVESNATQKVGIPRGIGVSAYLAELYMRDIDKEIASLKDVTYYARYVDDIIIVFTPSSDKKAISYKEKVKSIIENNTGLMMSADQEKTTEIELIVSNRAFDLSFLGYKFEFKNLKFNRIGLTESKFEKYKDRIDSCFKEFNEKSKFDLRGARSDLIHRLNFITGNTRLENNKSNVLIGIYYTNSLLTEPFEDLIKLDDYLADVIDSNIANESMKIRLKMFSFKKGFQDRKYVNFNSKTKRITLKQILDIF